MLLTDLPITLQWFDLEETSTGKLHLKLEWLSLLATPEKLEQVHHFVSPAATAAPR